MSNVNRTIFLGIFEIFELESKIFKRIVKRNNYFLCITNILMTILMALLMENSINQFLKKYLFIVFSFL